MRDNELDPEQEAEFIENMLLDTDRPVAWGGGTDVLSIMVDPTSFAATQMVMALATDVGGGAAVLTTKYSGAQWDATVNDVMLPGVAGATLYGGSVWLPSDFNPNLASGLMQGFVGVDSGAAGVGDVFLAVFAAPAGAPTAAFSQRNQWP